MRAPVIDLLLPLSPLFHSLSTPPQRRGHARHKVSLLGRKNIKIPGLRRRLLPRLTRLFIPYSRSSSLLSSEFALSLRFASSVSYLTIVVHLSISLSTFMHIYLSVYVYMCIRMRAGALARACE